MRTLELNQEQLNMLSDCILFKMEKLRGVGEYVNDDEVDNLIREKIIRLKTLLDYISA